MSIITLMQRKWLAIGSRLRAARIRRLTHSIPKEIEHADSYLCGRIELLERLKRAQHDDRTSEQVRRDVERAAKFSG